MMDHIFICDMQQGQQIRGYYLLSCVTQRQNFMGSTYCLVQLQDVRGSISGIIAAIVPEHIAGNVVYVEGYIALYNDKPQIKLHCIVPANAPDAAAYSLDDLLPAPLEDPQVVFRQLRIHISGIMDPDYRTLCQMALQQYQEKILWYPGGKSRHHWHIGGFALHTLHVITLSQAASSTCAGDVDLDLLTAGAFFHDIGKLEENMLSPLGLFSSPTESGTLLRHTELGIKIVTTLAATVGTPAEKLDRLLHIIGSHHANGDVKPVLREAKIVAAADTLNSSLFYSEAA